MKKSVLLLPVLLLVFTGLWAQQRTINGEVREYSTDNPIIGATIVATGTNSGTATNEKGRFSLVLPSGVKSLQVSYVGYTTQTIVLDTSSTITVLLHASENSLQQLVVVGYGSQRKQTLPAPYQPWM